jgi:hypothetical protein
VEGSVRDLFKAVAYDFPGGTVENQENCRNSRRPGRASNLRRSVA